MGTLANQTAGFVHGNRLVTPGDTVNLREKDVTEEKLRELRELHGNGPFKVSSIGRWPCGKVIMYLKGTNASEHGVSAMDLM